MVGSIIKRLGMLQIQNVQGCVIVINPLQSDMGCPIMLHLLITSENGHISYN